MGRRARFTRKNARAGNTNISEQMKATIKEKREVAKGTLLVLFDLDGAELDYRPGQYFFVELVDPPYEDEKGGRRHFTAVTSPSERGVVGFCTRLRESAFKRSVAELPVGTEADIEPPKGSFVLPEASEGPLVFVAGGIGITPFRSMLRYIADEELPHRVTLVYSNRDRDSAAFLDELEEIERGSTDLRLVATMTDDESWPGERRRIDAAFLRDQLGDGLDDATYMVAGPPGFAKAVTGELEEAGVDPERIATDSFSGY
jgi:ferredoxin-NADP reductase